MSTLKEVIEFIVLAFRLGAAARTAILLIQSHFDTEKQTVYYNRIKNLLIVYVCMECIFQVPGLVEGYYK